MVNLQDWVCVENNSKYLPVDVKAFANAVNNYSLVVIIAASIPALRPLLLQRKNGSHVKRSTYGLSKSKSVGAIKLASGPEPDSKNQTIALHARDVEALDGGSEEYILQDNVDDRIKRTTELQITYAEQDPTTKTTRGRPAF